MILLIPIIFLIFNVIFLSIAFLTPYDRLTKSAILVHTTGATLGLVWICMEIGVDKL